MLLYLCFFTIQITCLSIFEDHLHNPTFSELVLVNSLNTNSYRKVLATFNTTEDQSWIIQSLELTQELVICLQSPYSEKCHILDMHHQFLVSQQRLAFLSIKRQSPGEGCIKLYINCRLITSVTLNDWMDGLFQMHRQAVPTSGSLIYFDVPVSKVMKNFGCVYMKSKERTTISENLNFRIYMNMIKDVVLSIERRFTKLLTEIKKLAESKYNTNVLDVSTNNSFGNVSSGTPCQLSIGPYMQFMTRCVFRDDLKEGKTKRWTIILHRSMPENVSLSFDRSWIEYKQGFGSIDNEYWLGLDYIHELTRLKHSRLRIEAKSDINRTDVIEFENFYVSEEKDDYALSIDNKSSNFNEVFRNYSLLYHNDMKFTTKDRDNDLSSSNCARLSGGGWWFRNCATFLPTGKLYAFWMANEQGEQFFYNSITLMID